MKIILLDVDGTLVDYEGRLPDSAVRAVRSARKAGHRVYICTGRSRAEVYPNLWEIGLDGMIGGNGNYVEDHGHVVMHQLITTEQCRRAVEWLQARDLDFYLESNNGLFGSPRFADRGNWAVEEYARRGGKETMTVREVFPTMTFEGPFFRDDVNKISFVLSRYQDYLDAAEAFPDLEAGTWGGKGETALFGDLGVKGITKANAVQHLLDYLGADRADTVAFGDAKVDIPMLEFCQVGVAMGSGGAEIKAMADYVTGDVERDGLYQGFAHLGLLGPEDEREALREPER